MFILSLYLPIKVTSTEIPKSSVPIIIIIQNDDGKVFPKFKSVDTIFLINNEDAKTN